MKQIAIVCVVSSLRCLNGISENTQERDVDLLLVDSGDLHDGEDVPKYFYEFCYLTWSQEPVLLTDSLLEAPMLMTCAFQCEAGPVVYDSFSQANQFVKQLPYDIMAIGKCVSSLYIYRN